MSVQPLQQSSDVLGRAYDAVLLDLDGVVYVGHDAVPGVIDSLNAAHTNFGLTLTCVTNNAARSPKTVAEHLQELGLNVSSNDVVTSAQAGAAELAKRLTAGSSVFVLGSKDLIAEVELVGLHASQDPDTDYDAFIQGYWPDMPWRMLGVSAKVIRTGVLWVATNMDFTIPTPFGLSPGNGTMVNALAVATGRTPDVVAGKPEVPLMQQSIERAGAQHPLVVGDRLDTDIEGANKVGIDSLLVLSGVTTIAELLTAPAELRPTYISWDARGIDNAHTAVDEIRDYRGWGVVDSQLSGRGDSLDAVRLVSVAVWSGHMTIAEGLFELKAIGLDVQSA